MPNSKDKRKTVDSRQMARIERQFQQMGLGTEEQRQHYRQIGEVPCQQYLDDPQDPSTPHITTGNRTRHTMPLKDQIKAFMG